MIIYSVDVNFLREPPCNPSCFVKLVQAPCATAVTHIRCHFPSVPGAFFSLRGKPIVRIRIDANCITNIAPSFKERFYDKIEKRRSRLSQTLLVKMRKEVMTPFAIIFDNKHFQFYVELFRLLLKGIAYHSLTNNFSTDLGDTSIMR